MAVAARSASASQLQQVGLSDAPPPSARAPDAAALAEAALQAQTIARLHARVRAAEREAQQLREQLGVVRQQAANCASGLAAAATSGPPVGLPPSPMQRAVSLLGRQQGQPPQSLPTRKVDFACAAEAKQSGLTARHASSSPSLPELTWLTAHVAKVEAAEAAEARGQRIDVTLHRAAASREHGGMSRGVHHAVERLLQL